MTTLRQMLSQSRGPQTFGEEKIPNQILKKTLIYMYLLIIIRNIYIYGIVYRISYCSAEYTENG